VNPARARTLAVLACAAGAALALFAASRTWTAVVEARPAPLPAARVERTGAALHPWLTPLCLVALGGAGALLATRGLSRLAVGVLLVLCGLGVAGGAAAGLHHDARPGWPLLCLFGGIVVAAAGAVSVVRGRGWPALGARYERSANGPVPTGPQLWDALDRGDDPTA
jgi:hypothetical protein